MSAVPDIQQHNVAAAAGKSPDDHDQGQPHSAMNTHVILSGETSMPPVQRPDGSRINDRFPPATDKAAWGKTQLSQMFRNELQKKT